MPFGTGTQSESLLAPGARNSWSPLCCPSLPVQTNSFTRFSPAAQHRSPGLCLSQHHVTPLAPRWVPMSCPCHAARWGRRVLCVGAKRRASDKCQKKKRAAEPVAVPMELGRPRSRSQSVARSLIVVLWPGLWGASSLDLGLGLFLWGGLVEFFFLSPSPSSVGRERGDARAPSPSPPPPAV